MTTLKTQASFHAFSKSISEAIGSLACIQSLLERPHPFAPKAQTLQASAPSAVLAAKGKGDDLDEQRQFRVARAISAVRVEHARVDHVASTLINEGISDEICQFLTDTCCAVAAQTETLWIEALLGRQNTEALAVARSYFESVGEATLMALRLSGTIGDELELTPPNTKIVDARSLRMLFVAASAICATIKWRGIRHEHNDKYLFLALGQVVSAVERFSEAAPALYRDESDAIFQCVARSILYHVSDPYAQNHAQVGTTFQFIDTALKDISLQKAISHLGDIAFDPVTGDIELVITPRETAWADTRWRFIQMATLRNAAFETARNASDSPHTNDAQASYTSNLRVVRNFMVGRCGTIWDVHRGDRRTAVRHMRLRPTSVVVGIHSCLQSLRRQFDGEFSPHGNNRTGIVTDESCNGAQIQLHRAANIVVHVADVVIVHGGRGFGLHAGIVKWFRRNKEDTILMGVEFLHGNVSVIPISVQGDVQVPTQLALLVRYDDSFDSSTLTLIQRKDVYNQHEVVAHKVVAHIMGGHYTISPVIVEAAEGADIVTYKLCNGTNRTKQSFDLNHAPR